MRFRAVVYAPGGGTLARATVDMVVPDARGAVGSIGRGEIADGKLDLTADPGPIWGLIIDKQPILAVAVAVKADAVDLGEIHLLADGVPGHAFHAPDDRLFALPADGAPEVIAVGVKSGLTFGGMVSSAAQQLGSVNATTSAFHLTGANIRVRGVPTVSAEALALDFPNAELAASGAGLSELSFSLKGQGYGVPSDTGQASGPAVPNLVGYTRDLATRKLAMAGLLADVSSVIVAQAADVGRVVRQLPAAGASVAAGATVRLLIGKGDDRA